MGYISCLGCSGVTAKGLTCPELSPDFAIAWCSHCAPTFWKETNYYELSQENPQNPRSLTCVGCERPIKKACFNAAIRRTIVFCLDCRSKMIHAHRWVEFIRQARDEDLDGYAPNKLGLKGSLGGAQVEVTGRRR